MSFWLQLAILMAAIVLGARRGGMALGPMGGLGLVIFVFVFGLPPGSPPGTVLGIILAVITEARNAPAPRPGPSVSL